MSVSEIRKEFRKKLREGVDNEAIQAAHIKRVRQNLSRHKYNVPSQAQNKGKEISNGR